METTNNRHITTTIIVLIATTLLIGGAVVLAQQNESETAKTRTNSPKNQTAVADKNSENRQAQAPLPAGPSGYRDGNYTATGTYQSPGGGQEIKVNISLMSGRIMATSAEGDSKSSDSTFYQKSFISGYRDKVTGKSIDEVKLDHVGNSSLTPAGFNKALEDIKNQAKA